VNFNCTNCYGNPTFPNGDWVGVAVNNPASNQYAITSFTISAPNGWTITSCDWQDDYIENCVASGATATFYFVYGSDNTPLPPGAQALPEVYAVAPYAGSTGAGSTYPYSSTLTMTVQDESSSSYYAGNSFNLLVLSPTTGIALTVTPGGSNLVTQYTAGTAPYSLSAKVTCTASTVCPGGVEQGVPIGFTQTGYNPASTGYSFTPSSGTTSSGGIATSVFQPTNIATDNVNPSTPATPYAYSGPSLSEETIDASGAAISTGPGSPSTVSYTLTAAAFPTTDWLPFSGTTTNTNSGAHTFTGAVLCVATQQSCTGASPTNTAIGISAADRWSNPDSFGAGGVTFAAGQDIFIQTASGGQFDTTLLPSSITCGVTAGFACPVAGNSVPEPFNYYQGASYGTAGVLTTTITGTYGGSTFSVSGSSGTIETSTFANSVSFETTAHAALGATNVVAGKTLTIEAVLSTVQQSVPLTIAVCDHGTCGATSKGYTGSFSVASGVTNSSGIFSTTFTPSTKAGQVAILNATVLAPTNALPKNTVVGVSAAITTIAGVADKFTVVVGPNPTLSPSPISTTIPSATLYVNVVTSDLYGNPVSTVGPNQVQVSLVASPNTITVTSAYIPTNCFETNGTTGNGCSVGFSSFGPIAWTLGSTIGSTATISASGVLNGALTTSATDTITIVSKLPTLSVFSPKPLNNVIYSNSVNVQFRGWANVSTGYNDCTGGACPAEVTMSSLGWQVGSSGTWQSTGLAGTTAQWSVIATLPSGLSAVTFNATDSKNNVVVSSTYSVLVDTSAPTVTDVTTAGSTLNAGQLFQTTIVDTEGDLNTTYGAHGVEVTYNGTVLAASNVQLSGTNNLGSSVTYTLTALLPTGHWSVVVSAEDLAGNTGSSAAELVSVTVAFADSITFNTSTAVYGQVGAYKGITLSVTNSWSTSQTIVVYATFKSGTSIYVAQGTTTLSPGQTAPVFCIDIGVIPPGTYTVTFSAVTTSNQAVSAPTTPITITAT